MITASLVLFILSSIPATLTLIADWFRRPGQPAIRTGREHIGLQEREWYELALTSADFSR